MFSNQTTFKGKGEACKTNTQTLKAVCYRIFLQVLKEIGAFLYSEVIFLLFMDKFEMTDSK